MRTALEEQTRGTQVDLHALQAMQQLVGKKNHALVSQSTGARQSKKWGSGLEFDQLREYSFGDDPRFIDWKASSRLNTIYTKEFIEDKEANCLIIVDLQDAMFFGSQKRFLSTFACYSAALLAWRLNSLGYAIALTVISSRKTTNFPATHKEQQLKNTFKKIAKLHNSIVNTRTSQSLVQHLKPHSWQSFQQVAVITSKLTVDKEVIAALTMKQKRKKRLIIAIDDPLFTQLNAVEWLSDGKQTYRGKELEKAHERQIKIFTDTTARRLHCIQLSTDSTILDVAGQLNRA